MTMIGADMQFPNDKVKIMIDDKWNTFPEIEEYFGHNYKPTYTNLTWVDKIAQPRAAETLKSVTMDSTAELQALKHDLDNLQGQEKHVKDFMKQISQDYAALDRQKKKVMSIETKHGTLKKEYNSKKNALEKLTDEKKLRNTVDQFEKAWKNAVSNKQAHTDALLVFQRLEGAQPKSQ